MVSINLPRADGSMERYATGPASPFPLKSTAVLPRTVYAAAHVVADPLRMTDPWQAPAVDWDATLKFRHHLWGLGLKIAEAMDTSQRGMGLDWPGAKELIRRSLAEAKTVPGADLACGAGTDHLDPAKTRSLDDVIAAYEEQLGHVEACGGRAILMASRALCRVAKTRDDYLHVYDRIISQAADKVVLHWLGDMFDPQLAGYWASRDVDTAMETVLELIRSHAGRIEGIKISLLEQRYEEKLRAALPDGVKMYTGDDFNYADLIEGDGKHVSHALLGIFDPVAPAACRSAPAPRGRRQRRLSRDPRPDGRAVAKNLRGADAVLQGRRRLPRLAERFPGSFPHDRRHGIGPRHRPLRRDLPARRQSAAARRSGPRRRPDAPACRRQWR